MLTLILKSMEMFLELWNSFSVASSLYFSFGFLGIGLWGIGHFRQRFGRSEAKLLEPTLRPEINPPSWRHNTEGLGCL